MRIQVDPEQLTSTNEDIDQAVERIPGWQDRLDEVNGRLSGQNCNNEFHDLRDVVCDDLGKLLEMLEAFKGTLTAAADAFRTLDDDLATALTPIDPAPTVGPKMPDQAV